MISSSVPSGEAKTVAIVDPDPAVRHSLEFALSAEGYRITSFSLGGDLIVSIEKTAMNCLVVEHQLPDMSGLDLIIKVREMHAGVPAVLLVTHPDHLLQLRAGEERATIVEKPLVGDTLIDKIHELVTV